MINLFKRARLTVRAVRYNYGALRQLWASYKQHAEGAGLLSIAQLNNEAPITADEIKNFLRFVSTDVIEYLGTATEIVTYTVGIPSVASRGVEWFWGRALQAQLRLQLQLAAVSHGMAPRTFSEWNRVLG